MQYYTTLDMDTERAITKIQHWWRQMKFGGPRPCEDCVSRQTRLSGACYDCYYKDRYGPGGWDSYHDSD
jgi:hypothetical protein